MNDICPICRESFHENKGYPLSCHHSLHIECANGMIKAECPLCKEKIINLPKKVLDNIDVNGKMYRDELEQESFEALRHEYYPELTIEQEAELRHMQNPVIQSFLAMAYLRDVIGLPGILIPSEVRIEVDHDSPLPPGYQIFNAIIDQAVENVEMCMRKVEEEDVSEDGRGPSPRRESSEEEETDDEDRLFALEGSNISRRFSTNMGGLDIRFKIGDIPPLPR